MSEVQCCILPSSQNVWFNIYYFYFLSQNLTLETDLSAANGKKVKALEIFAYALQYFKEQALKVKPLNFYFQLFICVAVTNAVQPF